MSEFSGSDYQSIIVEYLFEKYSPRGLNIYTEVNVGSSIIGKKRRIDIFCLERSSNRAFSIECKYQQDAGTADEKIPYALEDISQMPMQGCIAYAGTGWSQGVLHMLQSSQYAAYCCPPIQGREDLNLGEPETIELDHLLAIHFGWWDILVKDKVPHALQRGYSFDQLRSLQEKLELSDSDIGMSGQVSRPETYTRKIWKYIHNHSKDHNRHGELWNKYIEFIENNAPDDHDE